MSEDSTHFDLRRTMSTGDIPSSATVSRPSRAHTPGRHRHHTTPTATPMAAANAIPAQPPSPPAAGRDPPETEPYQTRFGRTLAFFGYGRRASKARRALVSLIWNLVWGFVQFVFIVALLTVSTHTESKTHRGLNEWEACNRPLGVWNIIWIVRIFITCGVSYWGWIRDRTTRVTTADMESAGGSGTARSSAAPTTPSNPRHGSRRSGTADSPGSEDNQIAVTLPHSHLYARLSLLSSLITLTWFLTTHILLYTSISGPNSCRTTSPHLWWITFGVLGVMYLMVLEVFLLGFLVFIMAPLLFLFYNVILLCIGRHPVQNPHMIKPEIGKLPKSIVDRIPLVVYIPPPPDEPEGAPKVPEAIYTYPPKPKSSTPKRRFAFLKKLKGKNGSEGNKSDTMNQDGKNAEKTGEPLTWEENWEVGEFPFVRLEGNRAACAICLMDFEEPKRVAGLPAAEEGAKPVAHDQSVPEGPVQEIPVDRIQEEDRDVALKLEDAGEGAQPLRLLACGHVFHKTCIDPWLVDVSGRCPVCQRPVEVPVLERKKKRGRRNGQ